MFSIICFDKPNQSETRAKHRPAHVKYLQSNTDIIVLAGPMQDEDSSNAIGAIIIVTAESKSAAIAFAEKDPFSIASVYESVIIRPFKKVFPPMVTE